MNDNLNELGESYQYQQGYGEGLNRGRLSGSEEGRSRGTEEGARIASEVGSYRGHLMVWLQIISNPNPAEYFPKSSKLLENKLSETLDLINDFPRTNEDISECRLSKIRSNMKQIAIHGLNIYDSTHQ